MRPAPSANHLPQRSKKSIRNLLLPFLVAMLLVLWGGSAAMAVQCDTCTTCHPNFEDIHGAFGHSAGSSQTGTVVLFADNAHDDAGWVPPAPYFGVTVNCITCHDVNLLNVHANNCSTCHPTPYEQLGGPWQGTCQQGGCHVTYHADAITSHLPFEDTTNPANNCLLCHNPNTGNPATDWAVTQANCLNCHAGYAADTTPPVTSSNAQSLYDGGAVIVFSMMDNGKVGIGTTFYKLDGGPVTAGMQVVVNTPGQHTLEFWSVDQAGNIEQPANSVTFQVFSDTEPPVTTSNAKSTYYQGAVIQLTPTDNSASGVKATYYQINGGPTKTGTTVTIPATPGTINYTLTFWSEDWGYNIEPQNTVNFTVISGGGTLRLIWGDSQLPNPSYPPQPGDTFSWTVRRGGPTGLLVSQGSASYPWSGVTSINLPIVPEGYYVRTLAESVEWDEYWQTIFNNVQITTPGQVIDLHY